MEKTMKARVQHKHDIEANWLKATNFTPLVSEIIVYDPDENYDYPRIKIGDGKTNINTLPFVTKDYAKISDIPTKPADIGAQPAGNYLTSIPSEYVTENELNDKGYLTSYTETDPTVPAWAKADTKPTYTADEVGALPDSTEIPSKLSELGEDTTHRLVTDTEKEIWNAKSNFSGSYDDLTNKPTIPSTTGLASTTYVDEAVKNKVDKDGNKVLSTNDYTTAEKNKLANIAAGAEVNVNADWNATSGDAQILNKPTLGSMAAKNSVAKSDLASGVQTSLGKADSALQPSDISDWAKQSSKPSYTASEVGALPDSTKIPSKVSDLDNDKKYITVEQVPDEIYVGDGTMPQTATIQFIMDASDEEALLKNELQEYINAEIEAAKTKLELDIPAKTSQLTNDSGFITAEDIPEAQVPDLSDYAKTKDIPTKTSQLTNDSGFITAEDVPEAQVPDLSGYALKSSAETWTFTLSDGSKVTKKVVLA